MLTKHSALSFLVTIMLLFIIILANLVHSYARLHTHLDTLFRVAHSANFNTSIQALLLIQQLSGVMHAAADRFYRTLYESLLDPRLSTSSKHALYLNLLLRAIKNDIDLRRVKAFAKRMLQIVNLHQVPFACGILYVVSQVRLAFPDLGTLLEQAEDQCTDEPMVNDGDTNSARMASHLYDGRKRNPQYSNAHKSCLWEIVRRQPLVAASINTN